ncbi:head-tail connector protein [Sphingomonas sp. VDB2]|uniref:head-tail connector protein n=1 Tax=Sphingomonas sp. VDB2 TaxID=3228751 RepID=UPI003A80F2A4
MAEPITLEDARRQLNICDVEDDAFLTDAIVDARGWIEGYTGLILTRRTVTKVLPSFCDALKAWPIVSIDNVAYVDTSRADAVLASDAYFAQIAARPARLVATSWPAIYPASQITVTMTAGFASPADIKEFSPKIMRAMRILVAGFYHDREGGDVFVKAENAARGLCRDYRRLCV